MTPKRSALELLSLLTVNSRVRRLCAGPQVSQQRREFVSVADADRKLSPLLLVIPIIVGSMRLLLIVDEITGRIFGSSNGLERVGLTEVEEV